MTVPPLIVVTLALVAGQLLAGGTLVLPVVLQPAVAGVGLIALVFRRTRVAGVTVLAGLWGNVAVARVLSPTLPEQHIAQLVSTPRGVTRWIEATLINDPERRPRGARLLLQVERIEVDDVWRAATGRVLVTTHALSREWLAGDRLRTPLSLRRPHNLGNPGEFDYEAYLARQGIHVTAFLRDDADVELLDRRGRASWLDRWRRGVAAMIDGCLQEPERQVLRALIIGDSVGVPAPLQRAFVRSGVNHVLSISGLHIGMVAAVGYALWLWLLGRSRWLLLRTRVPKVAVAAGSVAVLLYAGIAGSNPATLRSVAMVLLFVGATLVDRQRNVLVSLAAAAFVICLVWPGTALDISFQLSFVAVLFLVLGMGRFWPWWRRWEERHLVRLRSGPIRWLRPVAAYFAVSVSALIGTAPLTAFYFNQVSWVALLANAMVVPLLGTVAVAFGLAAALIFPLSAGAASLAVYAAWPSLWLGDRLVEFFGSLPQASLRIVTPSLLELGLLYSALLTVLCLHGRRRSVALAALTVVAVGDASWWYRERFHRGDLRVTFLSIGQGDSAVVECPPSTVMVVDAGGIGDGSFDVGERVIAPFLWSRKIVHVDVLALSHPQWDHYGGFRFIAEQFKPHEFWSTGDHSPGSVRFAELQEALAEHGVHQVALTAPAERRCGEVLSRISGPARGDASVNDRSLVLQLERSGTRVLFTGDIEREAEAALLNETGALLESTVLKVPHHGSATSSTLEFVAAVAPQWAIASVGYGNRYGFPRSRTLATYDQAGARLLRTDRDGAVTVTIDRGGRVAVHAQRHVDKDKPRAITVAAAHNR